MAETGRFSAGLYDSAFDRSIIHTIPFLAEHNVSMSSTPMSCSSAHPISHAKDSQRPDHALPNEILADIFQLSRPNLEETTPNPKEEVLYPSTARALTPFRLGAVCRRWREITLADSTLWSYIAVPTLDAAAYRSRPARILAYVQLVLFRSRSVPIDIVFGFIEDVDRHHYNSLIAALEFARSRWRSLAAVFSGSGASDFLLDALRHPTPMLQTLQLSHQTSRYASSVMAHDSLIEDDHILPDAPQLQHLILANLAFKIPVLCRLHVYWESRWLLAGSGLWLTLAAIPNLRALTIWTDQVLELNRPERTVLMEHLSTLQLMFGADHLGYALVGWFKMPNLSSLVQRAGDLRYTTPLFKQYASNLRFLHLQHRVLITDDGVDALLQLSAVNSVSFTLCPVPRLLFECLVWRNDSSSVFWPNIEVLMLDGPVIEAGDDQPLVSFAKQRSHADAPTAWNGQSRWSRLEIYLSERTRLSEADSGQIRCHRVMM